MKHCGVGFSVGAVFVCGGARVGVDSGFTFMKRFSRAGFPRTQYDEHLVSTVMQMFSNWLGASPVGSIIWSVRAQGTWIPAWFFWPGTSHTNLLMHQCSHQ